MSKQNAKNWELEQDPVWVIEHNTIMPSPFFRKWWEDAAERQYSDRDRWIDAAIQLGYIYKETNRRTGKVQRYSEHRWASRTACR